jgi:crotonobetainyl-CoA:carnitine CoA-transferase CaiB-like acyl-CoA transferase
MPACSDLCVLEIADGSAGASLCGQLFAGLGAKVIKVESRAGDPLRAQAPLAADGNSFAFHIVNSGKTSAAPSTGDAARFRKLIDWADIVLIDTERSSDPFWSQPAQIAANNSQKIVCAISTFGQTGSRTAWHGNPLIAEAMGGLMACTGYPERPPVVSGVPYANHVTAMFAFSGVMAALHERETSGKGQFLDLATVDCLTALLGNFIPSYFLSGKAPKRIGNRHTIAAPWNLYPCLDGQIVICTGTGGASWWRIICDVMGRPELATDTRYDTEAKRVLRVDEVDGFVSDWTRQKTMLDAVEQMTVKGIPASEIASVEQILSDKHYTQTRAMAREVKVGAASVVIPGLPMKVAAWTSQTGAGPALDNSAAVSSQPARAATARAAVQDRPPLAGIRILEFASRTSVPMAGKIFADLGADVIKIEPPKGESLRMAGQPVGGSSYLFQINNLGKRSLVVEPKSPRGRELILEAVKNADVWMENLAPGALDQLGLGFEELRKVNPRLIYCSVSGFGHRSDYGKKKALDTVVQAASGVMYLTGYPDHLPVKLGISAVDLACAVGVVGAVLAAIHERRNTGKAGHIDLAMADIGVWLTQLAWPSVQTKSGHPTRLGNRSATMCPHNTFAALEGFLAVAVETDAQWEKLAAVLGATALRDKRFTKLAGRQDNVEAIEKIIQAWAAERAALDAATILQGAGVPAAPVRSLPELVENQNTRDRGLVLSIDHPLAGPLRVLGSPLRLSRTPAVVRKSAPLLGEHTREILNELGVSAAEQLKLQTVGVIKMADAEKPQKQLSAAQ